jgi:hypothetical protein
MLTSKAINRRDKTDFYQRSYAAESSVVYFRVVRQVSLPSTHRLTAGRKISGSAVAMRLL